MAFKLDTIRELEKTPKEKKESVSILQREITLFGRGFSNKIKEDFYAELSVLLKAGIPLKEALELLQNAQKKKANQEVLHTISYNVVEGKSFSEAVKMQKGFSDYEYYSIKIGEETGSLHKVTEQLGVFFCP